MLSVLIMSPAQEKMYWRRWSAVARANAWRMAGGRLDPAAVLDGSEAHGRVVEAARKLALREHRGLAAEDLRHGCHVAAVGREVSHRSLNNRQFDALLAYWGDERGVIGLLIEPLDLGSEIHRVNPELKSRERHLHFLRVECLAGYVASECHRIYGTKDWESLGESELAGLSDHMRTRKNAMRREHQPQRHRDTENPF